MEGGIIVLLQFMPLDNGRGDTVIFSLIPLATIIIVGGVSLYYVCKYIETRFFRKK